MSPFKKLVLISAALFVGLATTQANSAKSSIETRIVGGTQSGFSDWQWIVALSKSSSTANDDLFQNQFCGGSLINESWVLTAAHCVVDDFGDPISTTGVHAFVGEYDLKNSTGEYRAVDLVIVHPDYNSFTTDNDIALLRLSTPSNVTPVALIDSSVAATLETLVDDTVTDFTVIGWGSLTEDQSNPAYPSILEDVDLPYISNSVCNSSALSGQVTDNMICAGFPNGGFDSCQGDSGGPLVFSDGGQLSGIVSWGIGCAQANSYGVYTRLNNYIAWIDSILNGYIITPKLQFGSWLPSTNVTANLTIQNSSSSALTLDNNSFSTTNSAFTVLSNNCSSVVNVDATCVVTVEFASGLLSGLVTGAVTIGTDSSTVPVITVPLEATVLEEVTTFINVPAPSSVRWALSGNSGWTQEQVTIDGSLSFESGNINDNQTSSLYAYFDLVSDENVYFDWKTCSELDYDFLELWVDNVKINGISGDADWTRTSVPLSGGTPHVIEWRYNKDYIYFYGNDAGWVNNIAIGLTAANQNSLPVHSSSCDLSVTNEPQPIVEPQPISSSGGSMSGWVYLMFGLPLIMRRRFRKH